MIAKVLPFGLLALLMMVMMAPSAFAQDPTPTPVPNARADINLGGTRAVTRDDIIFAGTTLDGQDQRLGTVDYTWGAIDTTNSGEGWKLQMSADHFVEVGNSAYTISNTGFEVIVATDSIVSFPARHLDGTPRAGSASGPAPENTASTFQTLNNTVVLLKADFNDDIKEGMGDYEFDVRFNLFLPGLTTHNGSYSSILTISMFTGPM
jgi:hypothetical protein